MNEAYEYDNKTGNMILRSDSIFGHEHLQWCGLINMNARLYDPMVARFLSPDPMVQAPDNTQSLNRYSYCLNNPLKYVDPTGQMAYGYDGKGNLLYMPPTGDGHMQGILGEVVVTPFGVHRYQPNPQDWLEHYNFPNLNSSDDFWREMQSALEQQGIIFNTIGLKYGVNSFLQYNDKLEFWKGINGKIYRGLKGRGPNGYTGSRELAKLKASSFSTLSTLFSLTGTATQWVEYLTASEDGPNMKAYLLHKARESSFITSLQFAPVGKTYINAFCISYSFAQLLQDCGIHIRYNPYTKDFTPIEETLRYYDSEGIQIYF